MKIFRQCIILLVSTYAFSQDTYLRSNFPVRDFIIKNDTISYIEKRHVIAHPADASKNYFIGGYGLKIYDNSQNNEIITVSNELLNTVCSVRFYDKSTKKVEQVYYYTKARALDAILIKERKLIVLSLNDKKILIVDYSKKPQFSIHSAIDLKSASRRVLYQNDQIFYGTNSGELHAYSLDTKKHKMLLKSSSAITDFGIYNDFVVYSNLNGDIVKHNFNNKDIKKIKLKNNFVLNSVDFQKNQLIFGTFNGSIIVIDPQNMVIKKELKGHSRSVLKLYLHGEDLYSSSIDKTIKKWIIK